jgi:carbon-monoxide dehydrogenase large subunit
LLTVGGTYLDDMDATGAAFVTYVRSTMPHAKIVELDVAAAVSMPGVIGVVTAADLVGFAPPAPEEMANAGMVQPWLAADTVRYVGEPIAAIVHESRYQGEDAVEAVVVDYADLPAVVDARASATGGEPLFPELGTNVAFEVAVDLPAGAFEECEVVVRQRSLVPRVAPCPLEVRGAIATWTGDELTFSASTQTPHRVRDDLCRVFGLSRDQVRVVVPDVGGGFGAKIGDYPDELFIAWLARRFHRPLKWVESRSESMVAMGHGRAQYQDIEIGGRRDGRVTAYRLTAIQDAGAYPRVGATLPYWTRTVVPGPYDVRNVGFSCTSVLTNTTPVVAYRGAGRPEATAAIERAMDLFAAEIGVDPVEVRRRNLIAPGDFPYRNAMGVTYDSGDYQRALDLAVEKAGYQQLRAEQSARRQAGSNRQLGIGVSVYVEITNGTRESEFGGVELTDDGRLTVLTGTSPQGQGHDTTWAMLVSEQTLIPIELIDVVHGDTDLVPRGVGTYGSRSLQAGGVAVRAAAIGLVDQAREIAAELLEANPEDVSLDPADGEFRVRGTSSVGVTWQRVLAHQQRLGKKLTSSVDLAAEGASFPFGAHIVVVEVDLSTGQVTLERVVAVDDAGTIINPVVAEGQVQGGLAQGLANGLLEGVLYDDAGNPLTTNLADYPFITACELPRYETFRTETPTLVNPLGAKGIGEAGTIGATPAVQSAVVDALSHLGVRHVDIPATCGRVWEAIQSARTTQREGAAR